MPAGGCAPALATSDAAGEISFDCGSSWEVDLRSDAECAPSTFESTRGGESSRHRCHPRLTFGWLRNEVQLWRSGATLRAEHATAYCDLWGRGREENVLVSHAIDRPDVGERAGARRRRFHGRPAPAPPRASAAGVNVVVLILRGVGLDQARRRIPRTRSLLRRLHRSGAYQLASFGAFRALDVDGRRSLHALLHGGSGASDIWRVYRDWGYASAFGEAACSDAGARASGLGLRDEAAGAAAEPAARPDHVLLEPFCGLDAQLRAQRRPSPPARAGGSASAPQLGPAACVGQSASFEHLLNYTRAFVARAYPDVPKLVVASIPGSADRAWPADVDAPLSTALGGLLRSAPRTAVFVLSDTGPRNVATGGAGATAAFAAARPLLQLLVPSNVAPPGVMVANRRQNASMLDVHATLRELPALEHETRVAAAMHSASCRAHSCAFNASLPPPLSPHLSPPPNSPPLCAVGGCSLLRPLAPRRSCADALVPPSHCLSPSELAAAAVAANRTRSSRRRATRAAAARPRSSGAGGFGDPAAQPGGEGATNSEPTTREAMCAQRVAENRLRTSRGVAGRAGGHGVARAGEAGVGCRATPGVADEQLLAQVESEADVFACDAPRFARVRDGTLRLRCPPWRRPMYATGLAPTLQAYRGPTALPNSSEFVAAYCRRPAFQTTACQRVGHEAKRSNAAVLRRQCPRHSHGWVLDVAVRNVPKLRVYNRARRRRWRRWRAERGAASEVPTSNRSSDRRGGLGLNVLLLMLDSIAAERFARGMPITHALLERWRDADAGASGANGGTKRGWRSFKLTNFVVVGSNSPRNQFPMLSGKASLEWDRDHCSRGWLRGAPVGGCAMECIVAGFPETRASADHKCDQWVFDAYASAGYPPCPHASHAHPALVTPRCRHGRYVTHFGTNMCDWGVMEEVYPLRTRQPPTDDHLMEPWCHVDYDVDKLYFRPTSRCLGGRAAHAPLMQYERQLLRNYVGVPRISWQARTGHAATPTGSDLASGPPTFKPLRRSTSRGTSHRIG